MKKVTFKNGTWIEFEDSKLIPKIIKASWKSSKLEGRFILNPDEIKVGNMLILGKNQDDRNWICSDFIENIETTIDVNFKINSINIDLEKSQIDVSYEVGVMFYSPDDLKKSIKESILKAVEGSSLKLSDDEL